jgi:glycosyltransferase involved in cell wall biosynthesis
MASQMLTDWSRIGERTRARVAFLVRGLDGGGAQRDAILMANALEAMGVPSAIVTLEARGPLLRQIDDKVPVLDLGGGRKLRIAMALPALRRLLAQGRPAALVSSEAAANVMVVVASRLVAATQRPPLVLREVASPLEARRSDPYWQNRLAYRLAPFAYPPADRVVTFTAGVKADLVAHFRVPAATIFNLGTNAVLTAEMRRRLAAMERRPEGGLIVSVGRLSPEKGHAMLLDAFARLRRNRPARLVILGEGSERAHLEARVAELGLVGDVDLPGHVVDPLSVLRRAALFVSASTHEGLGNAIIEAMACGVPVVSTDAPHGPREILLGGKLGALVPVGDAAAFAEAMGAALDTPTDGEALARRAADFTVEAAASRFAAMLGEVGVSTALRTPAAESVLAGL